MKMNAMGSSNLPRNAVRSGVLRSFYAPLQMVKGVGPILAQKFTELLQPYQRSVELRDILLHLPIDTIDRRKLVTLKEAPVGQVVSLRVRILQHHKPPLKRSRSGKPIPYRIRAEDDSGSMMLMFYHSVGDYLVKQLPVGSERLLSGTLELYEGVLTMAHPDIIAPPDKADSVLTLQPVYAGSMALSSKVISKTIHAALGKVAAPQEWLDEALITQQHFPAFLEALSTLHKPQKSEDILFLSPARCRLAYDELLAHQLALCLARREETHVDAPCIPLVSSLAEQALQLLPFKLTFNQNEVLATLRADMHSGRRMVRLLQGDVGSGKTILALLAMLQVVQAGKQAALMAPTDLLARQHWQSFAPICENLGVELVFLSGKLPASSQREAHARIASGAAQIIVGTHALFQDKLQFRALGLVVIDEQHRFGVGQRLKLSEKGAAPHLLQLSATPIPRSLTMTVYGDMDASALTEKPPGRKPVDTRVVPLNRAEEVIAGLSRVMEEGQNIYWVCPLIDATDEDSARDDAQDIAAAEERFRALEHVFGTKVGLVHGKMKVAEREAVMQRFTSGEIQLLVATTVIEVGVNVPHATVMIIESAERFGLAQLHQLRGRVGRSSLPSRCILLYRTPLSDIAKERLQIIREHQDGFFIAEEDLRLRGSGDVLGTKQSGLPIFRAAHFVVHQDLLRMARRDAMYQLDRDPQLLSERGKLLRELMIFFGYDAALTTLRSA